MNWKISPCARALEGEVTLPGDKSIAHRALLFAAIADGESHIEGLPDGEDVGRTLSAVRALGVEVTQHGSSLLVHGVGLDGLRAPAGPIDCGNSGTSARLLLGLLAGRPFAAKLIGDASLSSRPMRRVVDPLREMGARFESADGGLRLPLEVGSGGGLKGGCFVLPMASAQVKSALLIAGLRASAPTQVEEPLRSRDHTERMLLAQGVALEQSETGDRSIVRLHPPRSLSPLVLRVPGDLSSAAFVLGAATLVRGSRVRVVGVGLNPTRTGVLDVLRAMGARIDVERVETQAGEPAGDLSVRATALRGTRIDGALTLRSIDELPLLAALAATAEGVTHIEDAGELRHKESDRIAATVALIRGLGGEAEERPSGISVRGGAIRGGHVDARGDHRIAMAAAVLALAADGDTSIDGVEGVATSFPGFLSTLRALGAER